MWWRLEIPQEVKPRGDCSSSHTYLRAFALLFLLHLLPADRKAALHFPCGLLKLHTVSEAFSAAPVNRHSLTRECIHICTPAHGSGHPFFISRALLQSDTWIIWLFLVSLNCNSWYILNTQFSLFVMFKNDLIEWHFPLSYETLILANVNSNDFSKRYYMKCLH